MHVSEGDRGGERFVNRKQQIEYKDPKELKPDPRNTVKHPRKQIKQLAASIRSFGFRVPVLINIDEKIMSGHARVEAAIRVGLPEIPVIYNDDLTPEQAQAFMIADNKLAQNSVWDDRLLAEQLKVFADLSVDFSFEAIGFEMSEVDVRIQGLEKELQSDKVGEDMSVFADQVRVSRMGDLWLLNNHRILCGDARHCESFERLMNGSLAMTVFIDPPYNIPIEDNVSGKGAVKHGDFAMACGELSEQEFTALFKEVFTLLKRHSRNGAIVFVSIDWRHIGELLTAGKQVFSEFKHLCVWAKDRASQGSFYRSQHELIFVFKNGTDPHINNIQLGKYGRYRTNVWHYPSAVSVAKSNEQVLAMHPTVKPTEMIEEAIKDVSNRGDIVLDSFLGSGTTVIAAERSGRVCYGMELDPKYVDVAVRRWQSFTGKTAIHEESGKSFAEIEEEAKNVVL